MEVELMKAAQEFYIYFKKKVTSREGTCMTIMWSSCMPFKKTGCSMGSSISSLVIISNFAVHGLIATPADAVHWQCIGPQSYWVTFNVSLYDSNNNLTPMVFASSVAVKSGDIWGSISPTQLGV